MLYITYFLFSSTSISFDFKSYCSDSTSFGSIYELFDSITFIGSEVTITNLKPQIIYPSGVAAPTFNPETLGYISLLAIS